ncbi:MAG: methionyl-tRNA formyltransferase [Opitutales bacterium]
MPKPRVVFFGSDAIALPSLEFLYGEGSPSCELVGILTQPDRPSGRGRKLRPNPVKAWASEHGIPVREPEKLGEGEASWLQEEGADLSLVIAYGHILSRQLLDAPDRGTFNLHGSLLPAYRGASPAETALAEGETETGVTLMRVVPRMDAGPMVDRETVPIEQGVDGPSLREKLAEACVPLLRRNLATLLAGEATEEPQDEDQATYCRKLRKEDGALDFRASATVLARRVAAFRGWPGSFFDLRGTSVKVGAAEAGEGNIDAKPGAVILPDCGGLALCTGAGVLNLLELQRPGGRMMPANDFLRGFPLEAGELIPSQNLTELLDPESSKCLNSKKLTCANS